MEHALPAPSGRYSGGSLRDVGAQVDEGADVLVTEPDCVFHRQAPGGAITVTFHRDR